MLVIRPKDGTPRYFSAGDVPDKLPLTANTFGATLGGPLVHNRLFFFGSLS